MNIVETFAHGVEEIEHCWIPLAGGERLSARLWIPEGARTTPVPAILEYIPYRKRDYTAVRDQGTHAYLAGHGYACVRVDVRGTGDSDGIHSEQWADAYDRDALEVLTWIAAQPWSDGQVAMMGLSWGGQTGLKMASLGPPELKCVIAVSAADDRYENKFLGGCLLSHSVVWGTTMTAQNTRPPDPTTHGEGWRELWLHRLRNTVRYAENWISHQRRDGYWASGSVVEHYGDFACPVYSVGGAADPGYGSTVPRLLENLTVPVKGLLGPWAHKYPHHAMPGPAIGFLQEALRWFDRWMKGAANGIDTEPAYRAWMHEFYEPKGYVAEKPGRWVSEPSWPSPRVETQAYWLNQGGLEAAPGDETEIAVRTPQTLGLSGGEWMPWLAFGDGEELALDQRDDDARSVVFDSEPLDQRLEMLGTPVARLVLSADKPVATVVVRLCDVAPDGTSLRVTYGALNLTRRDSLGEPAPVEPGRRYTVAVPLYHTGHAFAPGHRIRVAVSNTCWPLVWPAPEEATLTLVAGASSLDLPVRRPGTDDAEVTPFEEPECAPPMARTVIREPELRRTITRDEGTGTAVLTHLDDGGVYRIDAYGLECGARTERRLAITDGDPLSARVDIDWAWSFQRGDWRARTEVTAAAWCGAETFEFETRVRALDGDDCLFDETWSNSIPRDLM